MPSSQARAMLCAQEIVETEENYRRALGQLLRGEVSWRCDAFVSLLTLPVDDLAASGEAHRAGTRTSGVVAALRRQRPWASACVRRGRAGAGEGARRVV